MAKVITFSRFFPAYHPKAGQPTHFVEKFINSLTNKLIDQWGSLPTWSDDFRNSLQRGIKEHKHHTIRAGHRFKVGDYFSPRVWSGKPYRSKQIVIAPDTKIQKVWDIEIDSLTGHVHLWVGGRVFGYEPDMKLLDELAKNDGLELEDFKHWFIRSHDYLKTRNFQGQIICWNENINY